MDIETFNKANEIYDKLQTVNKVIESITVSDTGTASFKQSLADVVRDNAESFLTWINNLRIKYETEFNDLHCECKTAEDDDNSTEQENPK